MIKSISDLEAAIDEYGLLPFFKNRFDGYSVEEMIDPSLWFTDQEGPWEWKGPLARSGKYVYGKFFSGKAVFIRKDLFPDFANFRRDGYDFDSLSDEGMVRHTDENIYTTLLHCSSSLLSKELRILCGYDHKSTAFESAVTRLQMQTYFVIADFEYSLDKHGKPYGWGVARFATPEYLYGTDFVTGRYCVSPAESKRIIAEQIASRLPFANIDEINRFIAL